jgi:hypothetical protein
MNKLDKAQRDVASAKSQTRNANNNAIALKLCIEELQDQKPDTYFFQSRGNEIQFKTNLSIIADITWAVTAFASGFPEEITVTTKGLLWRLCYAINV